MLPRAAGLDAARRQAYHLGMKLLLKSPLALFLMAVLALAGPAGAQEVADAQSVNGLGGVMLSLLMIVGVLIGSFMSPRRGPQD